MPSPGAALLDPHALEVEDVLRRIGSTPRGLSASQAAERARHEGPNALPERARTPLVLRFGKHVTHRFALLLWAGAILAFVGERLSPGEGMIFIAVALAVVVLVNGAFGFWQELRVEHAMAAFHDMLSSRARVLRGGVELEIDAREVVVGDVIPLREGDRVPADARLLEAHALKVDNSPLTGESEPQLRTTLRAHGARLASRNLVFSGTLVTSGTGLAVVYAIGAATELGRVAHVTRETVRVETPIHRELAHFIRVISAIAIGLGAAFFAAGWILGNPFWTNLVFAIGIIVANVPEGLLPTVTLALAIAGRKMAKQNALLKSLEAAETLGGTTVICTDKTGTLTENEMRVTGLFTGPTLAPIGVADVTEGALRVMVLCNNATLARGPSGATALGDPTERALVLFVERVHAGTAARLRQDLPRVFERPFDSATREMATVCSTPEGPLALLKGAPEVVIEQCSHVASQGARIPVTDVVRRAALARADREAASGKRVLALARKIVEPGSDLDAAVASSGYELVGLVAMHDPPRPDVAVAVRKCRGAGIRVIVVSGDHPLTVAAIARDVGIAPDGSTVLTGDDLARLAPATLRHTLEREHVLFARTSPLDKLRIVTALQQMGHVVAVTGDGVNDAPALKRADIGIAMGRSGTDVAREAADMVLMDDHFATIVTAVEEGRVIYENIRRFIGYVLTSNVPEIIPYIAYVLLGIPLPLPVLLVLAIDLGTDMAPAIALAAERAETDVMQRPPRSRGERLLSPGLLCSAYLLWGMLEAAAGFAAYGWVLASGGYRLGDALPMTDPLYGQAIAAFFFAVVACQIANVMIWRTTRESLFTQGVFANRAILFGIAAELVLAWMIVQAPPAQTLFGTSSPPLIAWLVPIPFALGMLALSEAIKAARRRARDPSRVIEARASGS